MRQISACDPLVEKLAGERSVRVEKRNTDDQEAKLFECIDNVWHVTGNYLFCCIYQICHFARNILGMRVLID